MRRALHDFYRHIVAVLEVFGQPHRRKVAPAKLLHKHVTFGEHFSDVAGVIASNFVILNPLIFAVILVIQLFD